MAADESWDAVTKDSSDAVELGAWHWGLCLLSGEAWRGVPPLREASEEA